MDRKLFGIFSAWQTTVIILAAIVAPSAVYGVAAYQNVVVENPTTHKQALVDTTGSLQVVETATLPLRNPANLIRIEMQCHNGIHGYYTVPSGQALILEHVNFSFNQGVSGADNFAYLSDNSADVADLDSPNTAGSLSESLMLKVDTRLGMNCPAGSYTAVVDGFLIPAALAPNAAQVAKSGPVFNGQPH